MRKYFINQTVPGQNDQSLADVEGSTQTSSPQTIPTFTAIGLATYCGNYNYGTDAPRMQLLQTARLEALKAAILRTVSGRRRWTTEDLRRALAVGHLARCYYHNCKAMLDFLAKVKEGYAAVGGDISEYMSDLNSFMEVFRAYSDQFGTLPLLAKQASIANVYWDDTNKRLPLVVVHTRIGIDTDATDATDVQSLQFAPFWIANAASENVSNMGEVLALFNVLLTEDTVQAAADYAKAAANSRIYGSVTFAEAQIALRNCLTGELSPGEGADNGAFDQSTGAVQILVGPKYMADMINETGYVKLESYEKDALKPFDVIGVPGPGANGTAVSELTRAEVPCVMTAISYWLVAPTYVHLQTGALRINQGIGNTESLRQVQAIAYLNEQHVIGGALVCAENAGTADDSVTAMQLTDDASYSYVVSHGERAVDIQAWLIDCAFDEVQIKAFSPKRQQAEDGQKNNKRCEQ